VSVRNSTKFWLQRGGSKQLKYFQLKDDEDDVAEENISSIHLVQTEFEQRRKLRELRSEISIAHDLFQKINEEYLIPKYNNDKKRIEENRNKDIDNIIMSGLLCEIKAFTTSSSSLLFEEKSPRADVLENLGKIANEFLKCPTYPEIHPRVLIFAINKVMGTKVKRTKEKYQKCILQYSNSDGRLGILNVSGFVERIPKNCKKLSQNETE